MTAQTTSPAVRRAVRLLPDRADRPGWMRTLAAMAVIGVVVAGLVLASTAGTVRDGFHTIGHRTAPQVVATEDLYFALSDMDAELANLLLAGSELAQVHQSALTNFESRRIEVDTDLQQATMVTGADESAQRDIREILDRLGQYESLAAAVMLLEETGHHPAGQPTPEVLQRYTRATDLMRGILDTAHRLTETNAAALQDAYTDTEDTMVTARVWLVTLGLLVLGTLVGLQVLLRVAVRRRINPALALATVLAGLLFVGGFTAMSNASTDLRVAKKDAFDSLIALRQARGVSSDANADESRFLVDPRRADQFMASFLAKSEALAGVGANGITAYDSAFDQGLRAYRANNDDIRITGFFGTELRNITFTGERQAAEQTLTAFQQYQLDDRTIRKTARTDLRGAIAFCVDTTPGSSNDDFRRYDGALVALIEINQRAFDAAIGSGQDATAGWPNLLSYGGAFLIVALVGIGIRPRLAEYR